MSQTTDLLDVLTGEFSEDMIFSQADVESALTDGEPQFRALAYEILSSHPHQIEDFQPSSSHPEALLDYLLWCILENAPWNENVKYWDIHTRGEAFMELRIPCSPDWERQGAQITPTKYWDKIADFLIAQHPVYFDEVATHFLEAAGDVPGFRQAMRDWQKNEITRAYVEDLHQTLSPKRHA